MNTIHGVSFQIDQDFIASYQATYGFTETGEPLPPEALTDAKNEGPDSKEAKVCTTEEDLKNP